MKFAPGAGSHGRVENQEKQREPFVTGNGPWSGGELRNREQSVKLYGLKNCDTCRKALKLLPDAELVDVRADGVPDGVLQSALSEFGDALVNKRSTTWRNLSDEARESAPLELLKEHPSLMKRPLIERDGALFLGWTAETRQGLGVA